jgi:hypothetical protein
MPRALRMIVAGLALIGAAGAGAGDVKPPPGRSTDLPRPRDPDAEPRGELDAARRAGTIEAYDLFIARHPESPLAEIARRERAALAGKSAKRG